MSNCKIIALANQKGGVAKTTTTINLGVSLARLDKKVLLIDADAQANLTMALGHHQPERIPKTLATVMMGTMDDEPMDVQEAVIHHGEEVDFLASSIELSGIETQLVSVMGRENILKRCLREIKCEYDYILIDCMPSLGMMTINALSAADSVIIPTQPHYLSAKGLELLLRSVSKVKAHINPGLKIDGILMTMACSARTYRERSLPPSKASMGKTSTSLTRKYRIPSGRWKRRLRERAFSHTTKMGKWRRPMADLEGKCSNLAKTKRGKIKLAAYDDLFKSEQDGGNVAQPKIREIPIAEIDEFPGHPFKVSLDDDMAQLVESVKQNGIMTPAIARVKENGRYELVSGHRRKKACELAGIETLRCEVADLTDDEATIIMVESNLQRTAILPSEKAFAYKMRLEALNRQGTRTDLTSSPLEPKLRSNETLANQVNESRGQIHRYIRLTELMPELLGMVDERKLPFRTAVEMSYLSKGQQRILLDVIRGTQNIPSLAQATEMKKMAQRGTFTEEDMQAIMGRKKDGKKPGFHDKRITELIPRSVPKEQAVDFVVRALEFYNRHLQEEHGK